MVQWRIAWREMRHYRGRALLTLLSVVIGVAAVLAVGLSTGSARRAYHDMFQTITGRAALEIKGVGDAPLPETLLKLVRTTPGVAVAVPLVQRNAIMYYGNGRMKLTALGIDPSQDSAVRDYELVAGRSLAETTGVLLDAALAHNLGINVGDDVRLLVKRGLVPTKVVGLVKPRSGLAVSGGGVLFMRLGTAQNRFAARGKVDRIQLVLAEGADVSAVQSQLVAKLPEGTQVEPPTTRSPLAEETMLALENGLRLATAFSLLAAVFIIMNTFLMNVGQRRHQLAVMRAIGATRRQVGGLLAREALLMGLLGTILGVAVGLAGARLLNMTMSRLFQTTLPAVELRSLPLAVAVAFGVGVSLVGAILPARQASRITPQEGLSGVVTRSSEKRSRRSVQVGVVVTLTGLALLAACLLGWLPVESSVVFTVSVLIGLVLLLPSVLRPVTQLSEWVLRPLGRVEARLAHRQLLRHYGRTTLTIGVLFVAVSTGLGLANSVLDNVADVRHWYRTAIIGDFFVRAAMPDMEVGLSAAVPESVGAEIRDIPGVSRIDSIRFVSAKVNGQNAFVVALRNEYRSPAEEQQHDDSSLLATLPQDDRVIIGSVLSQRLGVAAGGTITLETRTGPRQLTVASIVNEYASGGLTVRMNRALAEQLLGIEGVDAFIVKADHADLRSVEQALQTLCAREGLLLQSYADLTAMIEGMMSGVVGSLWGLLVLGLIVAAFGVVNTLGMNVLEQTREVSLLRVVAMTRGQVRKTIVAQAVMLGLLGVTPGLFAGLAMAYAMNLSTMPVIGHPVAFQLHPLLLLGGFLAAMAIVLAAACIPAERAARLELASALHYE